MNANDNDACSKVNSIKARKANRRDERADLALAIEDTLDAGLPRAYTPELYRERCAAVFEHVYESYPERGAGAYAGAA